MVTISKSITMNHYFNLNEESYIFILYYRYIVSHCWNQALSICVIQKARVFHWLQGPAIYRLIQESVLLWLQTANSVWANCDLSSPPLILSCDV